MSKKLSNQDIIECMAYMSCRKQIKIVRAARHLRKAYKLSDGLKSRDQLLDEAVKELGD